MTNQEILEIVMKQSACDINCIVASVWEDLADIVWRYIRKYSVEHCFETPNMHVLNDALREKSLRICFMAEYFLPDVEALKELPCKYELRVLYQEDFKELYLPEYRRQGIASALWHWRY